MNDPWPEILGDLTWFWYHPAIGVGLFVALVVFVLGLAAWDKHRPVKPRERR
jgi:hypothetical protein